VISSERNLQQASPLRTTGSGRAGIGRDEQIKLELNRCIVTDHQAVLAMTSARRAI